MRKIDLHIHTISTGSDYEFTYDRATLESYIEASRLDIIAITNHNMFDLAQFEDICQNLPIEVLPGIEINLEDGHILVITDGKESRDFASKCQLISNKIPNPTDHITVPEFKAIFPNLSKYLLIPHYDKKPAVSQKYLDQLAPHITSGEVASPKKFVYCIKDQESLVPVYFSDLRADQGITEFPTRQTYINLGEISLQGIKHCLSDKNKVFLSLTEGHSFFEASNNGLRLSTGLNVILGERSSGKTHTLDMISKNFDNVKYLKQFSLLEKNSDSDETAFDTILNTKQDRFTSDHLHELKEAVDTIINIDIEANERKLDQFLSTLIKSAQESERTDLYSRTTLFNESTFATKDLRGLTTTIKAVKYLIDNDEYRDIIEKHISKNTLKNLICELILRHNSETELNLKKEWANDLIFEIKRNLQFHTAATVVTDVDLYKIATERMMVSRFNKLIAIAKSERTILKKSIQEFKIVATVRPFRNATDLHTQTNKRMQLQEPYSLYHDPYKFLGCLKEIDTLGESEYYKFFVCIEYKILNKHDLSVSGGERSEFRLLQEISDAQQYDLLLIDEPESSFDNLFLKSNVNELIKNISTTMPVVVVTHNNTVGASIKPDFLIYTRRTITATGVNFEIFSGYPSDKMLISLDGKLTKNIEAVLDCLEAGEDAYHEWRSVYETLKD